jgi:hypothetical protein
LSIPENVPSELIAGDTWRWTRALSDYTAPTWAATAYFQNQSHTFSVAGSASGTDHSFTIAAATTATYAAGRYFWHMRVTDGSITETVESGWLEVKPNPAVGPRDMRSWARRALDAVEAQLEGRATDGQQAMTIRDRSVSRYTLKELLALRDTLRLQALTEEGAAGSGRDIKVRYGRP